MQSLSAIQKDKIEAARALLTEDLTTIGKFEQVRTLLSGINPTVDKTLAEASSAISTLKKMQEGDIVHLTTSHLPEHTEEQKKRKKALLAFITSWKKLKAEVARVQKLYDAKGSDGKITVEEHAEVLTKAATTAKGPFGLITVLAVGIVAVGGLLTYLHLSQVSIVIKNRGCRSIDPQVKLPVAIPGIELPTNSIPDGGQAVAKLPPFSLSADGTQPNHVTLSSFGLTMTYNLPGSSTDFIFDHKSLIGQQTNINLGSSKEHELVVSCR